MMLQSQEVANLLLVMDSNLPQTKRWGFALVIHSSISLSLSKLSKIFSSLALTVSKSEPPSRKNKCHESKSRRVIQKVSYSSSKARSSHSGFGVLLMPFLGEWEGMTAKSFFWHEPHVASVLFIFFYFLEKSSFCLYWKCSEELLWSLFLIAWKLQFSIIKCTSHMEIPHEKHEGIDTEGSNTICSPLNIFVRMRAVLVL